MRQSTAHADSDADRHAIAYGNVNRRATPIGYTSQADRHASERTAARHCLCAEQDAERAQHEI